ncbi:MAG: hypothetical protein FWC79_06830 [Oscillospiraceae bacterium]|nr:hypothetical protein [Oscillospiraceae bacterium]
MKILIRSLILIIFIVLLFLLTGCDVQEETGNALNNVEAGYEEKYIETSLAEYSLRFDQRGSETSPTTTLSLTETRWNTWEDELIPSNMSYELREADVFTLVCTSSHLGNFDDVTITIKEIQNNGVLINIKKLVEYCSATAPYPFNNLIETTEEIMFGEEIEIETRSIRWGIPATQGIRVQIRSWTDWTLVFER